MNGGVIWSNAAAVFDKSIMGGAIQLKANKNSLVVGLVGHTGLKATLSRGLHPP